MRQLAALALILIALFLSVNLTMATCVDEVDCETQINQQNAQLEKIKNQQAEIQKQLDSSRKNLNSTSTQLASLQNQVSAISADLAKVEEDLKNAQGSLVQNKSAFAKRIRYYYIQSLVPSWLFLFSEPTALTDVVHAAGLRQAVLHRDRERIVQYTETIENLDESRDKLAEAQRVATDQLGQIQAIKNAQTAQVSSLSKTNTSLSNQINQINTTLANLTAKQKEIIAAKSGAISSPIGDVPPTGDPNSEKTFDPGFRPAFAVFSFGAYTHRNGMSQYGALGRANSGQNAEAILAAYYPGAALNKNYNSPSTITVNGTNEYGQIFNNQPYDFEDYVKHLYEVPTSWPTEVLRAQAVAARTYAVRYGSPICPSQSCQVIKKEINSAAWQQAVEDTRGWVLVGGPSSIQYSSTSGGYLNTSGWDTTSGNRSAHLTGGAYEAIAGSPWFYKGWYKSLYGAACGRSHPWLTQTEMVDLLNAYIVYNNGNSTDKAKVISIDYESCFGSSLSDKPYSIDEMRDRAAQLLGGTAYTTVTSVSPVQYSDSGYTSQASFGTNRGTAILDGQGFRDILNLRLPGRLAAKTQLYNIEYKF